MIYERKFESSLKFDVEMVKHLYVELQTAVRIKRKNHQIAPPLLDILNLC